MKPFTIKSLNLSLTTFLAMKKLSIYIVSILLFTQISCSGNKYSDPPFPDNAIERTTYVLGNQAKKTPVDINLEITKARNFALYVIKRRSDLMEQLKGDSQVVNRIKLNDVELDAETTNSYLISSFTVGANLEITIAARLEKNDDTNKYVSTGTFHMCSGRGKNCSEFLRDENNLIVGCLNNCDHTLSLNN